ncbi:MAG: type VII secretion protein EccB [Nocardioides sp.]
MTLGTDPAGEASAQGLATGAVSVLVDSGRGAYVRSGDWGTATGGSQFVVDANGIAYPLDGPGAAGYLGYDATAAPVVPDSWLQLLAPGVTLSRDAALCPPGRAAGQPCE